MDPVGKAGLRVELLCEDSEHEAFARRLLKSKFKLNRRQVFVSKAPAGQGAASQWVLQRYRDLVQRATAKVYQKNLRYLVIVDGDSAGHHSRKQALSRSEPQAPLARIAIWVPTWEIETWVLWLTSCPVDGHDVDETRSYKQHMSQTRFFEVLDDAVQAWQPARPEESSKLPSLANARIELEKLTG